MAVRTTEHNIFADHDWRWDRRRSKMVLSNFVPATGPPMFNILKAIFLGEEPTVSDLPPQAAMPFQPVFANYQRQYGVPVELLQRGWHPHQFGNTPVVIALPRQFTARFAADGTLEATTDKPQAELTAKLHAGFEDPLLALDFVSDQATQRRVPVHNVGPYRCFYDPGQADPYGVALRMFVVGIPGAVVVMNLWGTREQAATPLLSEVRQMIPHLIGRIG
jgi:hypothetical protein